VGRGIGVAPVAGTLSIMFRRSQPIAESRHVEPDRLFQALLSNVRSHPELEVIVDIDHSRLGAEAGSPMPPSHVLIWSDPRLDAAILSVNPVAAVDLPPRILAYEDPATGQAAAIHNRYEFVARRHSLPERSSLREAYESAFSKVTRGIPAAAFRAFASDDVPGTGLVTLKSPHDFETTRQRLQGVIHAQSDTVDFGTVDFAARSRACGVELRPLQLILFGGPRPGGRAMASAPTLGLDAFCQKLLVRQDEDGTVYVTFNDLRALAARQDVSGGLPLRVIDRRLKNTLSKALES
jgi:uncharacterized protein (DUF302 family)